MRQSDGVCRATRAPAWPACAGTVAAASMLAAAAAGVAAATALSLLPRRADGAAACVSLRVTSPRSSITLHDFVVVVDDSLAGRALRAFVDDDEARACMLVDATAIDLYAQRCEESGGGVRLEHVGRVALVERDVGRRLGVRRREDEHRVGRVDYPHPGGSEVAVGGVDLHAPPRACGASKSQLSK